LKGQSGQRSVCARGHLLVVDVAASLEVVDAVVELGQEPVAVAVDGGVERPCGCPDW